MKDHLYILLLTIITTIIFSSCNTTKFLADDESLLNKNEIVIIQKNDNFNSNSLSHRVLSKVIKNTEDRPVFEWVYEKLDNNINSTLWNTIRTSPENQELNFLTKLRKNGKIYPIREKQTLEYELGQHILVQPNQSRWKLWRYQRIQHKKKRRQEQGKSVRKHRGEAPVLLDSTEIHHAKVSMKNYLFGKGYLDAKIDYFVTTKDQKSTVRYYIHNLKPYYINSYKINSSDSSLISLVNENLGKSHIKNGELLSLKNYDLERSRISNLLRNMGYADFNPNFISKFNAQDKKDSLDIFIEIFPPTDSTYFQKYFSDEINVYIDISENDILKQKYNEINYKGINYFYTSETPPIKPSTIDKNIVLRPNQRFQQDRVNTTKARLNNLGIYKFVYVNAIKNSDSIPKINYNLHLSSLKRMSFGASTEISFTSNNNSTTTTNPVGPLLGLSLPINYKHRNLFKRAAIWDSYLELGTEIALKKSVDGEYDAIRSLNVKFQNGITLPGLIDWNGTYSIFKKLFFKDSENSIKHENSINLAKSQILTSYDYKKIDNFYTSHLISVSLNFEYPNSNKLWHTQINQIGIHYLDPKTEPAFEEIISKNPVYQRSFTQQLFTAFILNKVDFSYKKPANSFGESYKLRLQSELSGLEVLGVQSLYNSFSGRNDKFTFLDSIEYSKFIKTTISGSYLRSFDKDQALGVKVRLGLLVPIDNNSPYVKSFYAGGANSIRAWAQRDLGPGAHIQDETDIIYPFQVGDVLIELTSEYRFPLLGIFKGAVFLDMGNIWTINVNDTRDNSKLTKDFYKQIAVGTGIGLRMDIVFAVVRFDIGQKIRLPYLNEKTNNHWAVHKFSDIQLNKLNYNLALGYPF